MSNPRITLDLDRCQGYANCVMVAPSVFDIDDTTGQAVLRRASADESERSAIEDAVQQCPTEAISLEV